MASGKKIVKYVVLVPFNIFYERSGHSWLRPVLRS